MHGLKREGGEARESVRGEIEMWKREEGAWFEKKGGDARESVGGVKRDVEE